VFIDDTSTSLVIEIDDNGVGMTSEEQENLFNRYYRGTSTSTLKEGTGLGMAIAKQFIDIHQGTINVKSSPSQGTTIKIQFPLQN
jgi:signal transduction histidine kinase